MSRRRGSNGNLVVICWRDIPAQVNAGSGSSKIQRILPRRFQRAIDRAAMVAGKTQASQYVGEWRRKVIPGDPDDPEGAALRTAEELEAAFPLQRLDTFVATGGWDPENATEKAQEAAK
ncbi:MAG: virulence factor [bacterium]|nr:virulence factor [bacterium]